MIDHFMDSKGTVGPKTTIALVFLSIFTVFIIQNTEVVEIRFFFWHISLSRVVLLLGSLLIGVMIGLFIGWEAAAKKKKY
jgi:putative membrane protein